MNPPPTKRQRTNDADVSGPLTRSKYWLGDGNIVLQAESTQYRVHSSMLSRNSQIFQDMFSMPQPDTSEEALVEGCPVVVLSDRAEDVDIIISLFYDGLRDHNLRKALKFSQISAMLRLGKKYEIEHLKNEALERLHNDYSKDLASWQAVPLEDAMIEQSDILVAGVIKLALEFSLLTVLPIAFFEYVTSKSTEEIFSDTELSPEIRERCINGRDRFIYRLKQYLCDSIISRSTPCAACASREECSLDRVEVIVGLTLWGAARDAYAAALYAWSTSKEDLGCLCNHCKSDIQSLVRETQKQLWNELPSFFGLDDWDKLKDLDG